jgi:hypothetical protein
MNMQDLTSNLRADEKLTINGNSVIVHRRGSKSDQTYYIDSDGGIWPDPDNIWPKSLGIIKSNPPKGKYRVTNLYVDPDTGRLEIEYDNTPVE